MPDLRTLRRIRAHRNTRKSYQPYTLMDFLLDRETPAEVTSTLEVRLPGIRARAHGTFRASFKGMHREHPGKAAMLCFQVTCLAVLLPLSATAVALDWGLSR
ncbi:hypothetical protein ACIOJ9_29610 [Streptomyces sp. NPDC088175]|uniref:hypothetical protein n=1 Tax=unclassified Streptomyces TaxID=2593676 RepID=UPI0037F30E57